MSDIEMVNCSDKEFYKWFYNENNTLCISCTLDCKQSSKIALQCTKFNKKESKND